MITFHAIHQSLVDDERLKPRPAHTVLPDWKKDIPGQVQVDHVKGRTARVCPAIDDYLHLGWVIPLWGDIELTRMSVDNFGRGKADPNGNRVHAKITAGATPVEFHAIDQVKGAEPLEPPFNLTQLVKPVCPWLVETPPGWSVLILPLTLHEKRNKLPITPIPGIVNTDHWHQVTAACKWERVEPQMMLRAGTPLMHIIPFPRKQAALEAEFNVIEDKIEWQRLIGFQSDFVGSYRRQQRLADGKLDEGDQDHTEASDNGS